MNGEQATSSSLRPARLLGDVGGTHARLAWQEADGEPVVDIVSMPTAEHRGLADALQAYLRQVGRTAPRWCAIGIANPVTGDQVRMTNSHWSFSIEGVRQTLGFDRLVVINDFTALALALPGLSSTELKQVGGQTAVPGAAIGLIGPGTGLGVSGLVLDEPSGRWIPLRGEGGHVSLAPGNAREAAVLQVLRDRFGHASAERAVSGMGLEALHQALSHLDDDVSAVVLPADEIGRRALARADPRCVETFELFCGFLGSVAGNLALTLGALGGIYIGGGIVPRWGEAFLNSPFRARFEDKGRFRSYLEPIPVHVIDANVSPALRGVAQAL